MTKTPIYTIEVCFDCLSVHANGDTGGSVPDCRPWGLWGAELVTMGGDECYCPNEYQEECECDSTEFSWSPCEGCGSRLGGYRHTFTVWGTE